MHALKPACIIRGTLAIANIFRVGSYAQVFICIVQPIAIYMIYVTWVIAFKPHNFAMRANRELFAIFVVFCLAQRIVSPSIVTKPSVVSKLRKVGKAMSTDTHCLALRQRDKFDSLILRLDDFVTQLTASGVLQDSTSNGMLRPFSRISHFTIVGVA